MFNHTATNLNDKGIINLKRYNQIPIQENENIHNGKGSRMKGCQEEMFVQLLAKKANIIKDHLQSRQSKLKIVANIGPTMATFKLYDLSEEDSLRLHCDPFQFR